LNNHSPVIPVQISGIFKKIEDIVVVVAHHIFKIVFDNLINEKNSSNIQIYTFKNVTVSQCK